MAGAADAIGGRAVAPVTSLAREAGGDDRTGLVAALFAASAIIGAALGAITPRRQAA